MDLFICDRHIHSWDMQFVRSYDRPAQCVWATGAEEYDITVYQAYNLGGKLRAYNTVCGGSHDRCS